jgi:hypothetical protein
MFLTRNIFLSLQDFCLFTSCSSITSRFSFSPVKLSCQFIIFVFSHNVFHHSRILFLSCNIFLSLHDFYLFPFLSLCHPFQEKIFSFKCMFLILSLFALSFFTFLSNFSPFSRLVRHAGLCYKTPELCH